MQNQIKSSLHKSYKVYFHTNNILRNIKYAHTFNMNIPILSKQISRKLAKFIRNLKILQNFHTLSSTSDLIESFLDIQKTKMLGENLKFHSQSLKKIFFDQIILPFKIYKTFKGLKSIAFPGFNPLSKKAMRINELRRVEHIYVGQLFDKFSSSNYKDFLNCLKRSVNLKSISADFMIGGQMEKKLFDYILLNHAKKIDSIQGQIGPMLDNILDKIGDLTPRKI